MSWRVWVRPEAELDLLAAATWYDTQKSGLGGEYLESALLALRSLEEHALRHVEVAPGLRRALTRRFPYSIYYQVLDSNVFVVAVLHQSRQIAVRGQS